MGSVTHALGFNPCPFSRSLAFVAHKNGQWMKCARNDLLASRKLSRKKNTECGQLSCAHHPYWDMRRGVSESTGTQRPAQMILIISSIWIYFICKFAYELFDRARPSVIAELCASNPMPHTSTQLPHPYGLLLAVVRSHNSLCECPHCM